MQNESKQSLKSLGENLDDFNKNANLFKFKTETFLDSDLEIQKVCAFVLALCLIYNDIKDYIQWHMEINSLIDKRDLLNPKNGSLGGLTIHIHRLYVGILDELLELIKSNNSILENEFMKQVLKNLRKENREYWNDLVKLSKGDKKVNKLRDVVAIIRNNIIFHYAPEQLNQMIDAYKAFFIDNIKKYSKKHVEYAYVSRGGSMRYSRYFFADAMAEAYIELQIKRDRVKYKNQTFSSNKEFFDKLNDSFTAINQCLQNIVNLFFQKRKWGGQQVLPEL